MHPPAALGVSVRVRGTVQGVGFRPHVHRLATQHGLTGWVRNAGSVVEIEVDGAFAAIEAFLEAMKTQAPPLARIEEIETQRHAPFGHRGFEIRGSRGQDGVQLVPPDAATCPECLSELRDPADRRYRYPFTNCTHCGPRFTIIDALPYDRERTTMRAFDLCPECRAEYDDPANRRFHAEPLACPECGPRVWLHAARGAAPEGDAITACAERLRAGGIVAVKGLGGYQLACDATNVEAVELLRRRKRRYHKPFALMVAGIEDARRLGQVGPVEEALLLSREAPIVLLRHTPSYHDIAPGIAPGLDTVGVMLAYTPLHHLLLEAFGGPLVMTSGNLSEEPIAIGNAEAIERLAEIADLFLLHDRDIHARYDDSVVRVVDGAGMSIRRARGLAPEPIDLPEEVASDILACGAQQKGTFCLARGGKAYLSQHIGDLDRLEAMDAYRESLELYRRLFHADPRVVAHDLHPDYASTRFARELEGERLVHIGVQHHHAHVVSCMAEHGLREPVIGVAYDGTGFGTDGTLWGGEVLIAGWAGFRRIAHLENMPMLGGEAAILKPWRMAAGAIRQLCPAHIAEFRDFFERLDPKMRMVLHQQYEARFNTPATSSCGRLFDAVAALLDVRSEAGYEGQPAAELEAIADPAVEYHYPYHLARQGDSWKMDPGATLRALWREFRAGAGLPIVAAAFHNSVVEMTRAACRTARAATGIEQVCLSGGCFQNRLLSERLASRLREDGFEVFLHRRVPPNDGGIALGQALVAHALTSRAKA